MLEVAKTGPIAAPRSEGRDTTDAALSQTSHQATTSSDEPPGMWLPSQGPAPPPAHVGSVK